MKIVVDLNPTGSVGTVATVKTRRWFKVVYTTYICVAASPITGGVWLNVDQNGKPVSPELSMALNEAAQEAVFRRKFPTNG